MYIMLPTVPKEVITIKGELQVIELESVTCIVMQFLVVASGVIINGLGGKGSWIEGDGLLVEGNYNLNIIA